jgi:hypothetical protein
MLTDEELTTFLRRGFSQATANLDSEPAPVHVIRRRHLSARRRRRVVAVGGSTAALAAGISFAMAGQHTASPTLSRHAVAVPRPSSLATSISTGMKPASYKLIRDDPSGLPNCPANARAPVGKSVNPASLWYWMENGKCLFVGVGWADTRPADAAPLQIAGYPGLYGTRANGVRTIYAPVAPGTIDGHPNGGWLVLTLPADASQELVVRMVVVPAN